VFDCTAYIEGAGATPYAYPWMIMWTKMWAAIHSPLHSHEDDTNDHR
jgi:hypothetical protein